METAIVILQSNSSETKELIEFRNFTKRYIGTSRYKEDNDSSDGYRNGLVIDGSLSDKEKKALIDFSKNLFVFFLEGEDILSNDTNTLTQKDNESN